MNYAYDILEISAEAQKYASYMKNNKGLSIDDIDELITIRIYQIVPQIVEKIINETKVETYVDIENIKSQIQNAFK